jgi:hypothetical protein
LNLLLYAVALAASIPEVPFIELSPVDLAEIAAFSRIVPLGNALLILVLEVF